jgi:hypothetical protein
MGGGAAGAAADSRRNRWKLAAVALLALALIGGSQFTYTPVAPGVNVGMHGSGPIDDENPHEEGGGHGGVNSGKDDMMQNRGWKTAAKTGLSVGDARGQGLPTMPPAAAPKRRQPASSLPPDYRPPRAQLFGVSQTYDAIGGALPLGASISHPHSEELPNGGPALLYTSASWLVVERLFVRSGAALNQPIRTIWDYAALGEGCSVADPTRRIPDGSSLDKTRTLRALGAALGRVRLVAFVCVPAKMGVSNAEIQLELFRRAPMWRIRRSQVLPGGTSGDVQRFVLEKRQRVFPFAITGGKDGRASYVERTWGQRTPIQWYGDLWDERIRPIVDLHPKYVEQPFDLLVFKISRIWQRVFEDFGSAAVEFAYNDPLNRLNVDLTQEQRDILAELRSDVGSRTNITSPSETATGRAGTAGGYDWYIRLWDDNYFLEENLHQALVRFDPQSLIMTGKMAWRFLAVGILYPFAGGGAGWYLSTEAMDVLGPSVAKADVWFVEFRRKPIYLPREYHDEDVFLSAWLDIIGVDFKNIPGAEHVSPGLKSKQRCMRDEDAYQLRWDPKATAYFEYPVKEAALRIDAEPYAYSKPINWHYMSPRRLLRLEQVIYPDRANDFRGERPRKTNADVTRVRTTTKGCYPAVPEDMPVPPRGLSIFEVFVPDPPITS